MSVKNMSRYWFALPLLVAVVVAFSLPAMVASSSAGVSGAPPPGGEGGTWVARPEVGRSVTDDPTGLKFCLCNAPGTCSPCWEWVEDGSDGR